MTYTPNANFVGSNSFTYNVKDDGAVSNNATVRVNVTSPMLGDVDGDGDIDPNDRNLVVAALGTTVGPGDPRDLNGDGKVNSLDVFLLTQKGARPGCATQWAVGSGQWGLTPCQPFHQAITRGHNSW